MDHISDLEIEIFTYLDITEDEYVLGIFDNNPMTKQKAKSVWMKVSKVETKHLDNPSRIEHHINDKRHRIDGPAVEWADGEKDWYVDNKRHRTDGPAIEWADGGKMWYIDG